MGLKLENPPGATPLDPDEAEGLMPKHVVTQGQLNEWELRNILDGERWAFGRKHKDLLSSEFVRRLHKRMFGETWRWAGTYRTTGKNIGVDPEQIAPMLKDLCSDAVVQLEHQSYPLNELAARFHSPRMDPPVSEWQWPFLANYGGPTAGGKRCHTLHLGRKRHDLGK